MKVYWFDDTGQGECRVPRSWRLLYLEDGIEKFDAVCQLAKKYGASLVCLTIDEVGMAKTAERKVEIAERIYQLATEKHGLNPEDLVFDLLTFTVGSGDEEYRDAAIQTIDAIRELTTRHPKGSRLTLSRMPSLPTIGQSH